MTRRGFFDRLLNPEDPPPPPPIEQPLEYVDTFEVPLKSAIEGDYFRGVYTMHWTVEAGLEGAALDRLRRAVVQVSEKVTSTVSVKQLDAVQIDVNDRLSRLRWPPTYQLLAWSATVRLGATAEARRTAEEWEALQSQLAVEQVKHRIELEQLRHLREDIFVDPAVARSYWLMRHPDRPEDILDERFERIAEKLGTVPDNTSTVIAGLVREFLGGLRPEQAEYLLVQLGQVFSSFGRADLSDRLPPAPPTQAAA
jgi:hypothetical protein